MELLEVQNISKTYGAGEAAVHALKQASFTVPKGEFVAVVGESGSGKTTLLNLIGALAVILLVVAASAVLAAWAPARRMRTVSVTETINEL